MRNYLYILFFVSLTLNGQSLKVAQDYLDRSNYRQAIPLFEKITKEAIQKKDVSLQVTAQNGLADCYLDLGANYKAMAILKKDIVLLNKVKIKNYLLLAKTHQLLAICYDKLFLLDDYLTECKIFYSYYKKAAPEKEIYKALYYSYIGRYYNMRMIPEKAYYNTNMALKIYRKNKEEQDVDTYILYNAHLFSERNHAKTLAIKLKYIDSLRYFINKRYPYDNLKKARLLVSMAAPNIEVASELYNKNCANYNLSIECANRAISYYDEALVMNDKLAGFHHPNAALLSALKGLMLFYKKDYKGALENYEIGIKRLTVSPYIFTNSNANLIDLLKWKGWCLTDIYDQNKDTKLLYEIEKTMLMEEKYWLEYANTIFKSKQKFNTNSYIHPHYNDLAINYYKLYKETGKEKYISLYYENDEKSKYTALLENLFKEKKEPTSIISNSSISKTYESYDDLLLKINGKILMNSEYKRKFEKQYELFSSKQKQLQLFNDKKIASLSEIQYKLKDNEAILSYNVSNYEAHFYPFLLLVTNQKIKIIHINTTKDSIDPGQKNIDLLEALNHNNITNYKKIAYDFYRDYFQPITNYLPSAVTHIQIIPSAGFDNLPFDMLLTEKSKSKDYRKLPYLAKKYQFSYGLSPSISNIIDKKTSKSNAFSVFSPSFNTQELSKLKTATIASKSIANLYNANLVQGKNATVNVFSKHLKEDRIVVLLSHGKATTDENESKKGIYLSDSFLNLNDVYNLKGNCDFLLLGTCESGVGLQNQEGNINLARAFTAIGVKSILLASWKIDEKSSVQIITSFLKYLDQDNTKSEALQKAKLDYLATASPRMANPLYWAGLNITGNNETIRLHKPNYWWWCLAILPVIAGGWYFRKKKKLNNYK